MKMTIPEKILLLWIAACGFMVVVVSILAINAGMMYNDCAEVKCSQIRDKVECEVIHGTE